MKQQLRYFFLPLALLLSVGGKAATWPPTAVQVAACQPASTARESWQATAIGVPLAAATAVDAFVFDTEEGLAALGLPVPAPNNGTSLGSAVYTAGQVSLSSEGGTVGARIWNSNGALTLRLYKTSTLTLQVPAGCSLTKVTFGGTVNGTADGGTLSGAEWTCSEGLERVVFAISATTTLTSITVTYTTENAIPTVASIAELKQQEPGSEVTLRLGDAQMARVMYVYGAGEEQEAYVRDNSGAICFYGINPNVPFRHGQHLAGQITGRFVMDNGLPKFCAVEGLTNTAFLAIAAPITEPEVLPTEVEATAYERNIANWVRVKGLHVTADDLQTQEGLTLTDRFHLAAGEPYHAPYRGAIVDITGIAVPAGNVRGLHPMQENGQRPVVFVIDEQEAFVTPPYDYADVAVRLRRTLSADAWNTFCVPFDMPSLEGATLTEFSGQMTADGTAMLFTPATQVEAGKPYLVKGSLQDPTFEAVTLKAIGVQRVDAANGTYAFVGTYGPREMKTDKTERFLGEGDMLYWPEDDGTPDYATMKGMRAYFIVPAGEQGAKVVFADEITGIAGTLVPQAQESVRIYNLSGQRVSGRLQDLPKGIYIVNGHKIVKK